MLARIIRYVAIAVTFAALAACNVDECDTTNDCNVRGQKYTRMCWERRCWQLCRSWDNALGIQCGTPCQLEDGTAGTCWTPEQALATACMPRKVVRSTPGCWGRGKY